MARKKIVISEFPSQAQIERIDAQLREGGELVGQREELGGQLVEMIAPYYRRTDRGGREFAYSSERGTTNIGLGLPLSSGERVTGSYVRPPSQEAEDWKSRLPEELRPALDKAMDKKGSLFARRRKFREDDFNALLEKYNEISPQADRFEAQKDEMVKLRGIVEGIIDHPLIEAISAAAGNDPVKEQEIWGATASSGLRMNDRYTFMILGNPPQVEPHDPDAIRIAVDVLGGPERVFQSPDNANQLFTVTHRVRWESKHPGSTGNVTETDKQVAEVSGRMQAERTRHQDRVTGERGQDAARVR